DNIMGQLREKNSPYVKDLEWLIEKRDSRAFIKLEDYYKKVLGDKYESTTFKDDFAVTLELSALQYFPHFMAEARLAIERKELISGRYIRVRKMKEQVEDNDILAVAAAMNIIGASYVETLDTKGTDGSNIHLGGPATITGYFGGIGQPNSHALEWVDEFLHYYTTYGVRQVLNINPGTVLLGYFMHKIGIDIEFKISVYMGNDNPYGALWTLMTAKLFSRNDGTTSLIGFNFANSVNNETIELSAIPRKAFGLEDVVRFEHHIIETWKSIVIQPYDRREELLEVAQKVKNISAKHEGGNVDVDPTRDHPSDILDYFLDKSFILEEGLMDALELNFLDRHDAIKSTANALIGKGIPVIAARNLH
ncbi:MAG: hypothetical protein ACTSVZ_02485, partial [Promethearchaeota archaeon]